MGEVWFYWAALSLSFRLISIVNEHNSLGSPGKFGFDYGGGGGGGGWVLITVDDGGGGGG